MRRHEAQKRHRAQPAKRQRGGKPGTRPQGRMRQVLRTALMPLGGFSAGMALGAAVLLAVMAGGERATGPSHARIGGPQPEYVKALSGPLREAKPKPAPIVLAGGKGALADAPPRLLSADVRVISDPVMTGTTTANVVTAPGKTRLMPQPLGLAPTISDNDAGSDLSSDFSWPLRGKHTQRGGTKLAASGTLIRSDAAPGYGYLPQHPAIALVIDDLGEVADRSARALTLPKAVTLAFLPYGAATPRLARQAAAEGHDIIAHVPMQPVGPEDPGPGALMVHQKPDEVLRLLDQNLDRLPGSIVGLNNHMGSAATANWRLMRTVMGEAHRRHLLYLDSVTTGSSVARAAGLTSGTQVLERDIFLDHRAGPDFMLSQLAELETLARKQGLAIAIGHPHDVTLDVLDVWVRGLGAKGLQLVSLSDAARILDTHGERQLASAK